MNANMEICLSNLLIQVMNSVLLSSYFTGISSFLYSAKMQKIMLRSVYLVFLIALWQQFPV